MLDARRNVLRASAPLTENLYRTLVSNAVRRVQLHENLTDQALADELFVSAETIANARNCNGKLQGPTLFSLLTMDPLALEGFLQHFGRRSVPIEAKCDTDVLVGTSAAVHSIARAKSENSPGKGIITDHECLEIEADIDAAIEALSALKVRCEQIRKGRAA